jgi:hypothetical protein
MSGLGCGPSSKPAETAPPVVASKKFVFAPRVGARFTHTMRRLDEVTFEGHPVRFAEEWELVWNVEIRQETNLFVFRHVLGGLKLTVNAAPLLAGPEVAQSAAYFDLAFDGEGNVVDIRHTQSLTDAVAQVVKPENQQLAVQMFSAENLRMLFFARAEERGRELFGQNAELGSSWSYRVDAAPSVPAAERTLVVKEAVPCAKEDCVKVVRETKLNPDLVWQGAAARVEQFITERGGDPKTISLEKADVQLLDEMLIVPERMEFHGAVFDQNATLGVSHGGEKLTVHFRTLRVSEYAY